MPSVTGEEFSRWMNEQANFRSRLEQRLESHHNLIQVELAEIKAMVRETNGKTIKHGEAIAVIQREIEAIKAEDVEIERLATSIKNEGCSQFAVHSQLIQGDTPDTWSTKKKAAVAGSLVGGGALIWPFLGEVAKIVHTVLDGGAK